MIVTDFYTGDLNAPEEEIEKSAKEQLDALLKSVVKSTEIFTNTTVNAKRK